MIKIKSQGIILEVVENGREISLTRIGQKHYDALALILGSTGHLDGGIQGCIVGVASVVAIAQLMGASRETIISLAPKSVTTPIAMEVCQAMGGIPSLTAAIVVSVGLFGAIFGFKVLEVWHIKNPYSQGLSIGTASHAVGTSRAMEKGDTYGAYASLGLILNGLLTALLAPFILKIMWL